MATNILKNLIGRIPFFPVTPPQSTPVRGQNTANNGITTIYTVPANYDLLLNNLIFSLYGTSNALGGVWVANAVPIWQYWLAALYTTQFDSASETCLYIPPVYIPSGFNIQVYSPNVNYSITANILGTLYEL